MLTTRRIRNKIVDFTFVSLMLAAITIFGALFSCAISGVFWLEGIGIAFLMRSIVEFIIFRIYINLNVD